MTTSTTALNLPLAVASRAREGLDIIRPSGTYRDHVLMYSGMSDCEYA